MRSFRRAFALAKSDGGRADHALRYMKDNLDEALLFDFATGATMKPARLIRTTMTGDQREAVQAFMKSVNGVQGKYGANFVGWAKRRTCAVPTTLSCCSKLVGTLRFAHPTDVPNPQTTT